MKKFTLKVATLLGACLVASSSMAQVQVVKMETSMPEGSKIALMVNASHRGLTVDWGDGQVVEYDGSVDESVMKIEGTVKGKTITVTGNKSWNMLNCSDCGLEQLLLDKANLKSIFCSHNNLKTLNLKKKFNLVDLDCSYNQISHLVLSSSDKTKAKEDLPALKNLNMSHNVFTGMYSWVIPTLDNLNISDNKFTSFYPEGENLKYVNFANNQIGGILNMKKFTQLENLICNNNKFYILVLYNDGEHIKQLVCDNNELTSLSLAVADSVQDISCSNNQLKAVSLPRRTRLISYNASDNALDFSSLPGSTRTLEYVKFDNQEPFDVSKVEGMLQKDGVNYIPLSADWNDRKVVNFKDHIALVNGRVDVTTKWYSIMSDGSVKEMVHRKSSSADGDYYGSSSKFSFFTPQKKAYATFTSKTYDCTIQSQPMAIGDDVTGIVSVTDGQNNLQIQTSRGTLAVKGTGDLRVYSIDGKCMWQGVVEGEQLINLPQGVYVVNNKKVIL